MHLQMEGILYNIMTSGLVWGSKKRQARGLEDIMRKAGSQGEKQGNSDKTDTSSDIAHLHSHPHSALDLLPTRPSDSPNFFADVLPA